MHVWFSCPFVSLSMRPFWFLTYVALKVDHAQHLFNFRDLFVRWNLQSSFSSDCCRNCNLLVFCNPLLSSLMMWPSPRTSSALLISSLQRHLSRVEKSKSGGSIIFSSLAKKREEEKSSKVHRWCTENVEMQWSSRVSVPLHAWFRGGIILFSDMLKLAQQLRSVRVFWDCFVGFPRYQA